MCNFKLEIVGSNRDISIQVEIESALEEGSLLDNDNQGDTGNQENGSVTGKRQNKNNTR